MKLSMDQEIKRIPISVIKPNPYQPRKQFDQKALEELSQSIKTYGVIQPINVRRLDDINYELIAGERRLRASKLADMKEIPAIVVDRDNEDSAIIAMMENLQREDLNFIEEAYGYDSLIREHGFTQKEIAEKIGKSQSTIANKLRVLKLPKELQTVLVEENLTERHGRVLLKLPTDELKAEVLEKVIKNSLNVRKTEDLVEKTIENLKSTDEDKGKQKIKSLINIKIYLNTLKNAYSAIKDTGINAEYEEVDKGDYVEVRVKIPKNKN